MSSGMAIASRQKPAATGHPLDPLSKTEMADAVKLLREGRKLSDSFRFVSCVLLEPPKQVVRDHKPGRPVPRRLAVRAEVMRHPASGQIGYGASRDSGVQESQPASAGFPYKAAQSPRTAESINEN